MVIEPVFHDCEPFSEGLALVEIKDDSGERFYGYIDKTGNFVIEPKLLMQGVSRRAWHWSENMIKDMDL